jgi:hypothetical protein
MTVFFVTTNFRPKDNNKPFQFSLETDDCSSVEEFFEILESGSAVVGTKFNARDPSQARARIGITMPMVGMIQLGAIS